MASRTESSAIRSPANGSRRIWRGTRRSERPGASLHNRSAALKKMYSAPVDRTGKVLFPTGHALGSESDEWKQWAIGRGANYQVASQFLRYMAFDKPQSPSDSDPLTFDFAQGPASLARARAIYDATSVDLRAFKARGGKILMWHGWADTSIPAGSSIDYYLRATNESGGRAAIELLPSFPASRRPPLLRRRRRRSRGHADAARQVGGRREGAGRDRDNERIGRRRVQNASRIPLPKSCPLQRQWQSQ